MTNPMTPTEQDKELQKAVWASLASQITHAINCTDLEHEEQDSCEDFTKKNFEQLMQLITADRKRVALEAFAREARLLNALAGMYEQYCGKKYGHDFMGAGEEAISILEDYGVHDEAWEWDEKSDENLSRALARIEAQQEEV